MKRTVIAVSLMMLLFVVSAAAQSPAPQPGPEHKKLEIWVGDWTWEGEYFKNPLAPAGKFTGKANVRSILGGFFVEWRAEDKGNTGTTQWYEIDGYDPVTKKYTWNNFASDGSVQTVTYTIEDTKVAFSGTVLTGAKQAKIRGTFDFAPNFLSNVGKGEISLDGKIWTSFFEIKNKIVKPSTK